MTLMVKIGGIKEFTVAEIGLDLSAFQCVQYGKQKYDTDDIWVI